MIESLTPKQREALLHIGSGGPLRRVTAGSWTSSEPNDPTYRRFSHSTIVGLVTRGLATLENEGLRVDLTEEGRRAVPYIQALASPQVAGPEDLGEMVEDRPPESSDPDAGSYFLDQIDEGDRDPVANLLWVMGLLAVRGFDAVLRAVYRDKVEWRLRYYHIPEDRPVLIQASTRLVDMMVRAQLLEVSDWQFWGPLWRRASACRLSNRGFEAYDAIADKQSDYR